MESGDVSIDGVEVTRASERVSVDAKLTIWQGALDEPGDASIEPDDSVDFEVVHEDADLIVIEKPAGLVVHPGAGNRTGTLANGLVARFPGIERVGAIDRPGIVHRLDADTSGLLAVARSEAAYAALVDAIAARQVSRRYLALGDGVFEHDQGTIEAALGRARRDPTRMTIRNDSKPAVTHYEVQQRYKAHTLVECRLVTGRTHQIRVHLSSIGHALASDRRYGGRQLGDLDRHFLHAARLGFAHPVSGKRLEFSSPLPSDLTAALTAAAALE